MSGRAPGPSRIACFAVLLVALGGGTSVALARTCLQRDSIAVDISRADTVAFTFSCRGFGQTFVATDTLILSISVWVPPLGREHNDVSHLFITEAVGDTPDVERLIYSGPSVSLPLTEPVLPTELRFDLDPPVALPHPGKFFFVVQAGHYSAFPMLASNADPYRDGRGWQTEPVLGCDRPGSPRGSSWHPDLLFKVVFCTDRITGSRRSTWREPMVFYR